MEDNASTALIKLECSDYTNQSLILYKALPKAVGAVRRIKVRHRQLTDSLRSLAEILNIESQTAAGIITAGTVPPDVGVDQDVYQIFPVNGYRSAFSLQVQHYDLQIQALLNLAISPDELISYTSGLPSERHPCQVLIWDISHFYAIRQ